MQDKNEKLRLGYSKSLAKEVLELAESIVKQANQYMPAQIANNLANPHLDVLQNACARQQVLRNQARALAAEPFLAHVVAVELETDQKTTYYVYRGESPFDRYAYLFDRSCFLHCVRLALHSVRLLLQRSLYATTQI